MTRNASLASGIWRILRHIVPNSIAGRAKRVLKYRAPAVGAIDFGDLARTTPIDPDYGWNRGAPIDRYYIERFLGGRAADIRGRTLEVGETLYSRMFGSGITRQDVLHVHAGNPEATIVGDLSQQGVLPPDAFDCMVVTQTLQLIYDMESAVGEMRSALKPGGVLLATVPGVTSVERGEWKETWYWALTEYAARRIFENVFGPGNVTIEVYGNVFAATCFLQGIAAEEVPAGWLDRLDRAYPVIIGVRAIRAQ